MTHLGKFGLELSGNEAGADQGFGRDKIKPRILAGFSLEVQAFASRRIMIQQFRGGVAGHNAVETTGFPCPKAFQS